MTECQPCEDYLRRRRATLLPYIGRWLQRQRPDRPPVPPRVLVDRLVKAHHRRFCLGGGQ